MKVWASWSIWSRSVSVILPYSDTIWLRRGAGGERDKMKRAKGSERLSGVCRDTRLPCGSDTEADTDRMRSSCRADRWENGPDRATST